MQLGVHMRELWGQKVGLAVALAVAILATAKIGLGAGFVPPRLEPDSLNVSSASTHVLVDTPRSAVTDLRQTTYSYVELTNRALLLGNVMASLPVRSYISRRAGIPASLIKVSPPLTPEEPQQLADSAHQPKTADILRSPDEYRLSIGANPTVPVLDIYSEAPDTKTAEKLANGAVDGLRDYLGDLSARNRTPRSEQVRLTQFGRATGEGVNPGAPLRMAIVVFVIVFAGACALVLFISRVRRGWAESDGLDTDPLRHPTA